MSPLSFTSQIRIWNHHHQVFQAACDKYMYDYGVYGVPFVKICEVNGGNVKFNVCYTKFDMLRSWFTYLCQFLYFYMSILIFLSDPFIWQFVGTTQYSHKLLLHNLPNLEFELVEYCIIEASIEKRIGFRAQAKKYVVSAQLNKYFCRFLSHISAFNFNRFKPGFQ